MNKARSQVEFSKRNDYSFFMVSRFAPLVVCLTLVLCPLPANAAEVRIQAFNTYLNPPFLNADGSGLAQATVEFLNRRLKGQYRFTLENVPRERLVQIELSKEEKFAGIVLLLAPPFVGDSSRTRFLWSEPVFEDYNVLVFAGMRPPPLKSLADLKGMRFASILGNRYAGLDDMVAEGTLTVERTTSELANLQKVAVGRADFTQVNRLLFFTMAARADFASQISAIQQPGDLPFLRSILVGKAAEGALPAINRALRDMPNDAQWRTLAQSLGLDLLGQ